MYSLLKTLGKCKTNLEGIGNQLSLLKSSVGQVSYFLNQKRYLNIHEYLSYGLLHEWGVAVPAYGIAKTVQDAKDVAKKLGSNQLIMKAQVLSGGRGKGQFKRSKKPGVIPFSTPEEAGKLAEAMLGDVLVTKQSGPEGKICNAVMICQAKKAVHEYYLSITMSREFHGPVIVTSTEGGTEIEKVAASKPEAIQTVGVDIMKGLDKSTAEGVAKKLGLESKKEDFGQLLKKLYDLFIKCDSSLVEINPLIQDDSGKIICLDAKLNFDDNAEYRQKPIFGLRDFTQEDMREVQAAKFNLNYISLTGNIGCMVNGAGLAMSTLDLIQLVGGYPANFLDVGGGATADQVKEAFKIITSDPKVTAVLVNIFGGIMRCDVIAQGILSAVKDLKMDIPIVVRLQGTKFMEAKALIASSGLKIIASDDLTEAATLAVKLANIVHLAREAKIIVKFEIPI